MLLQDFYNIQEIRETEENKVTAIIELNKDHEVYKGHFPGNPVVPGVCLTQIVKEVTESYFGKTLFMESADHIKFMAVVNPEVNPLLHLDLALKTPDEKTIKVTNLTYYNETVFFKLKSTFTIVK